MDLLLVRHAEPEESARGRCYGSLDVGLSTRGRDQCAALADRLAALPVARVLSSPRRRAHETAAAIAAAHGLGVVIVDALRELDFGELEGRSYDAIEAAMPDLYGRWMAAPTSVRFPGGEAYDDLRARVAAATAELRRSAPAGETVVAVTHGGVVRCVVAETLGMPDERIFRLGVDTASITHVRWTEDEPVLLRLNERV